MNALVVLQVALPLLLVLALAVPAGWLLAATFEVRSPRLESWCGPIERGLLRLAGVDGQVEMRWSRYLAAVMALQVVGLIVLFGLLVAQAALPFNPRGLPGLPWHTALNVAVSFVTNTNWQSYSGEVALSPFVQAIGLGVQNFVSAAVGLCVLAALTRGLARRASSTIGNFWNDLVRILVRVLVPGATLLALFLVAQGVVQTPAASRVVTPVAAAQGLATQDVAPLDLALGPAASQVAIKQLGTNGGGFFNANSAHPLENPTPHANLWETIAILLLPAAGCIAFGLVVGRRSQGVALLAAMLILFVPALGLTLASELAGTPALDAVSSAASGNLEGKELRFGVAASTLWATATTAASNGSVNAMFDSFTALGALAPMALMQTGEVVFGGVGSGLYGMILFLVLAVFAAGQMVGRTPEYLGKKLGIREMQLATVGVLAPSAAILIVAAVAVVVPEAMASTSNPGPHAFSQVLYAASSAGGNNGSAFAGLAADTPFWNVALALAMLVGRYGVLIPVVALAGAFASRAVAPEGPGTLPTNTPLFVGYLAAVVVLIGSLTFLPALALGPIAEAVNTPSGPTAAPETQR